MNQKKSKVPMIVTLCLIAAIYIAVFIAEQTLPSTSMLFTVLKKGAASREVVLPPGTWFADDGATFAGPCTITVPTPLARLPHFVRKR